MPISVTMPYRYGQQQEDDQDPYNRTNDTSGPGAGGNTPRAYTPPRSQPQPDAPDQTGQYDAPQTFAQMQEQGYARPPAPTATPVTTPPITDAVPQQDIPAQPPALPPTPAAGGDWNWAAQAQAEQPNTSPTTGNAPLLNDGGGTPVDQYSITPSSPDARVLPDTPTDTTVPPATSTDLLSTLLSGSQGDNNATALNDATEQATLDQLNNPSPYNSDEVRAEYDWLGGNIDDQYDTRNRELDNEFARKGLYGSSGKDFHSGRASDLNVGRRTAKTSMARDLAERYATSFGNYNNAAIDQGQQGTQNANQNQLSWLNALFGYGQQGFNNDLATAQFNENQNMDQQQLLQWMLQYGYGA